jgi:hypothetical protein
MSENEHGNTAQGGYHPLCTLPRPHSGHVISRPYASAVNCFGEPKSTPAPQSGYTHCACRDCPDVTVSSDMSKPELCEACAEAGCGDPWASLWGECQRDDAYGEA